MGSSTGVDEAATFVLLALRLNTLSALSGSSLSFLTGEPRALERLWK